MTEEKPIHGLRDQIRDIAERRVNAVYAERVSFPLLVTGLAAAAFMEEWQDGQDVRALRHACRLMHVPGWIADDEKVVE